MIFLGPVFVTSYNPLKLQREVVDKYIFTKTVKLQSNLNFKILFLLLVYIVS